MENSEKVVKRTNYPNELTLSRAYFGVVVFYMRIHFEVGRPKRIGGAEGGHRRRHDGGWTGAERVLAYSSDDPAVASCWRRCTRWRLSRRAFSGEACEADF